ncbi:hypothetical protein FIV42_07165 [Persicimonas caeni]|uniref:Uncharacterized protein n=1 Tax=Persicimonas caeni TaxID=2292766 RepID=A0A4Y6PQX9_PERCE|nr:hypothetical protein [Persicimonas caeni]QDG50519.1 hypothetical protein FIV42_07165 [Persicimonas caeni]QED31740.1 hypothetical protein FRD00_07160 [Persicimonas caeni]
MSQPLEALVYFQKSVYKLAKKQLKSLGKDAKKARKKEDCELADAEARAQLDETLDLVARQLDVAASREAAEATARASVVVDGEVLLEDVPPRVLVTLRKQLGRLSKTAGELAKLHADSDYESLATRAQTLEQAVVGALQEANQTPAPERHVSQKVLAYLKEGG